MDQNDVILDFIVVGAGLIGPRHASHIYSRMDCKLSAIIDHSAKGPSVADKFNCLLFQNIDEYCDYIESNNLNYPDGAIIATPNHTHVKMGMQLASKGINLLVEKPLSPTAADCKTLIDYCRERGVKLLVGHHRRFNPYILTAKKNLHKIGRPVAIQGSWMLKKNDEYFQEKPWRSSTELGGGTLLINLIHDLDLLLYLMGPIKKIYAELLAKQRSQDGVDEGAVLTITFENGCCGTFICSDNVVSPFNFESGTGENPTIPMHSGLPGFYRVFGSNGTLSVPDLTFYHQNNLSPGERSWLKPVETENLSGSCFYDEPSDQKMDIDEYDDLGIKTPSPSPYSMEFDKPKPFDLQLNHFVNLILNKEHEVKCSGEDALRALLCIETVMKSVASGKPEIVENIENIPAN